MNLNIQIEMVGYLFPAISLLFLSYTNRFLTTGQLIRSLGANIKIGKSKQVKDQIKNLKKRLELIKLMQLFGAIALLLDTISLALLAFNITFIGNIVFIISMITMVLSLSFLIYEIMISTIALNIELKTMNGYNDKKEE